MHNRWQSFTVFMFYLVRIFQFYSFIVLQPPLILGNNKYCNCRGVRKLENIGNDREESGCIRSPDISRFPTESGFSKILQATILLQSSSRNSNQILEIFGNPTRLVSTSSPLVPTIELPVFSSSCTPLKLQYLLLPKINGGYKTMKL